MSKMKDALMEIMECEICGGKGIYGAWVDEEGDYDFDWCTCNPHHLVVELDQQKEGK